MSHLRRIYETETNNVLKFLEQKTTGELVLKGGKACSVPILISTQYNR